MTTPPTVSWWARGLLFENCNCTLVCPGHMHFEQNCTNARCTGYWAIRFDEGRYGDTPLGGVRAVVSFDSPQRMIDGGWTEAIIIDQSATAAQREAVDAILRGRAGGPWQKLGGFVGRWLDTRFLPIELEEEPTTRRGRIAGLFEAVLTNIRGRDRTRPVMFENIFNQIHAPAQVIASGTTTYDDGVIRYSNTGTHGLHSRFDWKVAARS